MSLLFNGSYANSTQPLWESVNGGNITGNLNVSGSVDVGSNLIVAGNITSTDTLGTITADVLAARDLISLYDSNGTLSGNLFLNSIGSGVSESLNIYVPNQINFRQSPGPGTTLTLGVPGTNTDSFVVTGNVTANSFTAPVASGTGVIGIGTSSVGVICPVVTATSKIFLSFKGVSPGPVAGSAQERLTYDPASIVPGTSFLVYLADNTGIATPALITDVEFDWLVIN
jgi:hypothetical protein